ncbi:porin [Cytophagales bacterium LB-30]|uniref:Porin n=1 Tax=Shiella aurantiaca TaxID=3058365 RepID=A0ABT8F5P8_9BACT|nr:porin [Shiella aurantiaca]MDN4165713.1 porin [Shiella aurantiaca]
MKNTSIYQTTGFKRDNDHSKKNTIFETHWFKRFALISVMLYVLLALITPAKAQDKNDDSPLKFSGYLETYYLYDFANPEDHNRPGFVYSYNRLHEVTLNLGYLHAAYQTDKVRANLALMTGTYANANLAAEPGVLKNIFEANVGVKLSDNKELWLDAGILPSHIGFESAVGASCWNLTRSMLADNSPYFESGAKLSYTSDNEKWYISGLVLNGWQRIQRVDGNNTPAFGHQLTFTPNDKITLNSSSFIGSDTPDSTRQMRYFHNFYGQFQVTDRLALIAGFDMGAQQQAKESSDYYTWYSPVLIAQFQVSDKVKMAVRGEYYSDADQVIIATGTPNGFQTFGYSANLDYLITENVLWRIEARGFNSEDQVFEENGTPSSTNFFLAASLAVSLK